LRNTQTPVAEIEWDGVKWILVIDFCENINEPLCSITGREYLECKAMCQLVKRTLLYESVSHWLDQVCKVAAARSTVKPTAGV
jgi:hypothetical protein